MPRFIPAALGWHQALPDVRDYSPQTPEVQQQLDRLPPNDEDDGRPAAVDLRPSFPEIYDQGRLHSSPAQACVALVEYFDRRAHGRMEHLSRLFLHTTTRRLLTRDPRAGADLRTTLKALVGFGAPPERFWPYDDELFDLQPDAFLYSFAEAFRDLQYVRLDDRNSTGPQTLEIVKDFLAAGIPVAFGFPVPNSLSADPDVPYRPTFDSYHGGQAVVAAGYDDARLSSTKGALLIRSSWGGDWGDGGYGWLPYAFVEEQLAVDFWTLLRPDWLASGEFWRPGVRESSPAELPQTAH